MIAALGRFIVFEGLDGCGSTTQARLLEQWFEERNQPVHHTKEPTDGPFGSVIQLFIRKRVALLQNGDKTVPLDEETQALAFATDRMYHLQNVVIPKLASGFTVISDRYYLSSLAYQGTAVDYSWLKSINSKCRRPDLTVFLDVPPSICKKRIERKRWGHSELYENELMLERVRGNYLVAIKTLQKEGENIAVVNGNRTIQDVHKEIISLVKSLHKGGTIVRDQLYLGDLIGEERPLSSGED